MRRANARSIDSKGVTSADARARRGSPDTPWPGCHGSGGTYQEATIPLERQPRTQLDLTAGSGRLGDRAKLRRVHEAVGRAQVRVIEAVEELAAELKLHSFSNAKVADHCQVQRLSSRSIDRISAYIAKCKGGWSHEGGGVEPASCGLCAGTKLILAGGAGTNWVLTKHRSGIRRVAKNGDCKRKTGLHLIDRGNVPISRDGICDCGTPPARKVVDRAEREAVAHIAGRPLLRREVIIVLWDRRLKHWRAEVGRITQVFRPRVIRQYAEPFRIAAAHIDVARVIPALGSVLKEVDGAYRKSGADYRHVGRQHSIRHKADGFEWAAWTNRTWAGGRVVDQVSSLQMNAMGAQVSQLKGSALAKTLLHRCAPLFDVLRGGVRIQCSKADRGLPQHRFAEVETVGDDAGGRHKIVALLRLGKNVRHIVALVAPRVHVNWRVEDAECAM